MFVKRGLLVVLLIVLITGCAVQQVRTPLEPKLEAPKPVTVEPIKVGFLGPLTGDVSVFGVPCRRGVEAAVAAVNFEGGVNGRPIQVIYEDDKCNGKEGSTAANKLMNVDEVSAIVGGLCSAVSSVVAPLSLQAKIPMVSYGSSKADLTYAGDYFFRIFPSDALQGVEGVKLIDKLGYKKIGVLYRNDEYGVGFKDVILEEMDNKGIEVVAAESFEADISDHRTELTKVKSADPDLIYLISFAVEAGRILVEAQELGIDVPFIGTEAFNDKSLIEQAGNAAEGVLFTYPVVNKDENYQKFKEAYVTMHGELPPTFSAEAWDALHLVVEAMKISGTSGIEVQDGLTKIGIYNGASGTFEFDENGDVYKPYSVYGVVDGDIVQLSSSIDNYGSGLGQITGMFGFEGIVDSFKNVFS